MNPLLKKIIQLQNPYHRGEEVPINNIIQMKKLLQSIALEKNMTDIKQLGLVCSTYINCCLAVYINKENLPLEFNLRHFLRIIVVIVNKFNYIVFDTIYKSIIEIILDPSTDFLIINDFVQFLYTLLNTRKPTMTDTFDLCKLMDLLCSCGDYNLQTYILEVILRLTDFTTQTVKDFFPQSDLQNALLKISNEQFEVDCRYFLNKINVISKKVFSIQAESVYIGKELIIPPMELQDEINSSHTWIDFNTQSKQITIVCAVDTDGISFDTIQISSDIVKKIDEKRETGKSKHINLVITLSSSIKFNFPANVKKFSRARTLKMAFKQDENTKVLITNVLPNIFPEKYLMSQDSSINSNTDNILDTLSPKDRKQIICNKSVKSDGTGVISSNSKESLGKILKDNIRLDNLKTSRLNIQVSEEPQFYTCDNVDSDSIMKVECISASSQQQKDTDKKKPITANLPKKHVKKIIRSSSILESISEDTVLENYQIASELNDTTAYQSFVINIPIESSPVDDNIQRPYSNNSIEREVNIINETISSIETQSSKTIKSKSSVNSISLEKNSKAKNNTTTKNNLNQQKIDKINQIQSNSQKFYVQESSQKRNLDKVLTFDEKFNVKNSNDSDSECDSQSVKLRVINNFLQSDVTESQKLITFRSSQEESDRFDKVFNDISNKNKLENSCEVNFTHSENRLFDVDTPDSQKMNTAKLPQDKINILNDISNFKINNRNMPSIKNRLQDMDSLEVNIRTSPQDKNKIFESRFSNSENLHEKVNNLKLSDGKMKTLDDNSLKINDISLMIKASNSQSIMDTQSQNLHIYISPPETTNIISQQSIKSLQSNDLFSPDRYEIALSIQNSLDTEDTLVEELKDPINFIDCGQKDAPDQSVLEKENNATLKNILHAIIDNKSVDIDSNHTIVQNDALTQNTEVIDKELCQNDVAAVDNDDVDSSQSLHTIIYDNELSQINNRNDILDTVNSLHSIQNDNTSDLPLEKPTDKNSELVFHNDFAVQGDTSLTNTDKKSDCDEHSVFSKYSNFSTENIVNDSASPLQKLANQNSQSASHDRIPTESEVISITDAREKSGDCDEHLVLSKHNNFSTKNVENDSAPKLQEPTDQNSDGIPAESEIISITDAREKSDCDERSVFSKYSNFSTKSAIFLQKLLSHKKKEDPTDKNKLCRINKPITTKKLEPTKKRKLYNLSKHNSYYEDILTKNNEIQTINVKKRAPRKPKIDYNTDFESVPKQTKKKISNKKDSMKIKTPRTERSCCVILKKNLDVENKIVETMNNIETIESQPQSSGKIVTTVEPQSSDKIKKVESKLKNISQNNTSQSKDALLKCKEIDIITSSIISNVENRKILPPLSSISQSCNTDLINETLENTESQISLNPGIILFDQIKENNIEHQNLHETCLTNSNLGNYTAFENRLKSPKQTGKKIKANLSAKRTTARKRKISPLNIKNQKKSKLDFFDSVFNQFDMIMDENKCSNFKQRKSSSKQYTNDDLITPQRTCKIKVLQNVVVEREANQFLQNMPQLENSDETDHLNVAMYLIQEAQKQIELEKIKRSKYTSCNQLQIN